jgi:hypothetical protein
MQKKREVCGEIRGITNFMMFLVYGTLKDS